MPSLADAIDHCVEQALPKEPFNSFLQAGNMSGSHSMLVDDFFHPDLVSKLGTRWLGVSDRVMGGISEALITRAVIEGRNCLRLTGDVRLENDGGFIQAACDLDREGASLDLSGYAGLRLVVRGNGERYSVHLRTVDNTRPWQSYRGHFTANADWSEVKFPFDLFVPHRIDVPLDISRLRRIGLVAIGRAFGADLAVSEIAFYR